MSLFRRALVALAATALAAVASTSLQPTQAGASPSTGAVYVLSNETAANRVLVFDRAPDGSLTSRDAVDAGGTGTGAGLGSQGAIVTDDAGRFVYAVNAGSNTIASFRVTSDGLERVDVAASGGTTPTSVTVHGGLVYVLNAQGSGSIVGFTTTRGHLHQILGSTRPLSGAGTAPAQVSFTSDGSQLVVTERASNRIDLYEVEADGTVEGPTSVASSGPTPFGFGFDNKGHLIVSEAFGGAANASAVSSYDVDDDGLAAVSPSVATTETAACWIAVTDDGRFAYAGNAGGSVSGYRISPDGSLLLLDEDGRTAAPGAGVLDLAVSRDSRYLYARLGNGSVAGWAIASDGSLQASSLVGGFPTTAAGIAAR